MNQKKNYDVPTQVLVEEEVDNEIRRCMAIAYNDFIIFADNGAVCPLIEVTVLKEYPWLSFNEEICDTEDFYWS